MRLCVCMLALAVCVSVCFRGPRCLVGSRAGSDLCLQRLCVRWVLTGWYCCVVGWGGELVQDGPNEVGLLKVPKLNTEGSMTNLDPTTVRLPGAIELAFRGRSVRAASGRFTACS